MDAPYSSNFTFGVGSVMTSQGQVLADLEVGNGSTMYSAGHTEKRPRGTEDFT